MSNVSLFISVNVLGAILVLGGYVIILTMFPEFRSALWGGIKGTTQSLFTISMLLAAAGYLLFYFVVVLKSNPDSANTETFRLITCLSLIFLIASAIWMPATITYIGKQHIGFWILAVFSLWITATALISLVVWFSVSDIGIESSRLKTASIIGLIYITFHCLVLDAIIWVFKFPLR
ncbi:MAG: hypothetical protein FI698_02545 [SAR202 cluster bacterium]|nr:hypothetical protein [SAR202 cluster bacterium]|tara:strand:+ start:2913 stop:3443 length:531 start_codon:yes stop_codon:yes gene_type:complete